MSDAVFIVSTYSLGAVLCESPIRTANLQAAQSHPINYIRTPFEEAQVLGRDLLFRQHSFPSLLSNNECLTSCKF